MKLHLENFITFRCVDAPNQDRSFEYNHRFVGELVSFSVNSYNRTKEVFFVQKKCLRNRRDFVKENQKYRDDLENAICVRKK